MYDYMILYEGLMGLIIMIMIYYNKIVWDTMGLYGNMFG